MLYGRGWLSAGKLQRAAVVLFVASLPHALTSSLRAGRRTLRWVMAKLAPQPLGLLITTLTSALPTLLALTTPRLLPMSGATRTLIAALTAIRTGFHTSAPTGPPEAAGESKGEAADATTPAATESPPPTPASANAPVSPPPPSLSSSLSPDDTSMTVGRMPGPLPLCTCCLEVVGIPPAAQLPTGRHLHRPTPPRALALLGGDAPARGSRATLGLPWLGTAELPLDRIALPAPLQLLWNTLLLALLAAPAREPCFAPACLPLLQRHLREWIPPGAVAVSMAESVTCARCGAPACISAAAVERRWGQPLLRLVHHMQRQANACGLLTTSGPSSLPSPAPPSPSIALLGPGAPFFVVPACPPGPDGSCTAAVVASPLGGLAAPGRNETLAKETALLYGDEDGDDNSGSGGGGGSTEKAGESPRRALPASGQASSASYPLSLWPTQAADPLLATQPPADGEGEEGASHRKHPRTASPSAHSQAGEAPVQEERCAKHHRITIPCYGVSEPCAPDSAAGHDDADDGTTFRGGSENTESDSERDESDDDDAECFACWKRIAASSMDALPLLSDTALGASAVAWLPFSATPAVGSYARRCGYAPGGSLAPVPLWPVERAGLAGGAEADDALAGAILCGDRIPWRPTTPPLPPPVLNEASLTSQEGTPVFMPLNGLGVPAALAAAALGAVPSSAGPGSGASTSATPAVIPPQQVIAFAAAAAAAQAAIERRRKQHAAYTTGTGGEAAAVPPTTTPMPRGVTPALSAMFGPSATGDATLVGADAALQQVSGTSSAVLPSASTLFMSRQQQFLQTRRLQFQ